MIIIKISDKLISKINHDPASCCKCKINAKIVTALAKQRKDFKCIYTGTKTRID